MGWSSISIRRKTELFGLLLVTLSLFVMLSLFTHSFHDDRWFAADDTEVWTEQYRVRNSAGLFGGWIAFVLVGMFGLSSFGVAALGVIYGLQQLFGTRLNNLLRRTAAVLLVIFIFGVILQLGPATAKQDFDHYSISLSGGFGYAIAGIMGSLLGRWGAGIVLVCLLAGFVYLFLPWRKILRGVALPTVRIRTASARCTKRERQPTPKPPFSFAAAWNKTKEAISRLGRVGLPDLEDDYETEEEPPKPEPDFMRSSVPYAEDLHRSEESDEPEKPSQEQHSEQKPQQRAPKAVAPKRLEVGDFQYPALELLTEPETRSAAQKRKNDERATVGADALRDALATYNVGIADDRIEVFPGPVITRYEFKPAPGVKVNQIVNLADDLALALRAQRVRIVAPVPGKAAVGIEVPNLEAEDVLIREILQSQAFTVTDACLPLALGKDISGNPFVVDLATMPHLLIAGATGSGKSVCINAIITSLLFRLHPSELRFLFVDPKMLELSVYQGIPHLEKNVVSRPRAAERILEECVREMEERYRMLAGAGVRNVGDYNDRVGDEEKLPYLVMVVDELADLMMSASANKIETLVTRLAQMARAVGIHLILATQRPSVDVITGLIKANFSSRIAFQVASKVDSRTIIDTNGAEKLLGRGDMLFLSPGTHTPIRLHGAFISSAETERLVEHLKSQVVDVDKIDTFEEGKAEQRASELDPEDLILRQAADVVVRHKQGSVSLLQRRLGIGYQRAARLIDRLEAAGVVGPYDGSKAREVLVTKEQLPEKFRQATPAE